MCTSCEINPCELAACAAFEFDGFRNKETVVSRAFAKHGLRLDIEISHGQVGTVKRYPYIKVESLIKALDNMGQMHKLIGFGKDKNTLATAAAGLQNFWEKYKVCHGGHEVFELSAAGAVDLQSCVPVYIHGDEGTTFKRDGCFVLSCHSPLGRGTLSNKLVNLDDAVLDPHTNFAGHSFETRFLLGALLRDIWQLL